VSATRFPAIALAAIAIGCAPEPDPPAPARETGKRFSANLHGRSIQLIVDDCEVFLLGADGKRERVVTTDSYPMFSSCEREEISADNEYITVYLGRTAFGAGGCCATSGTWRSRDGGYWERRERGRWMSPEEVAVLRKKQSEQQTRRAEQERKDRPAQQK